MELWIERVLQDNNWIQSLFFLFLVIILILKLFDPIQFNFFIKFLNHKQYLRRYCTDRNFDLFNLFYILINSLTTVSFSFLILVCDNVFFNGNYSFNRYLYILVLFNVFIVARFFLTNFINISLNIFPDIKIYYFKNIIFYGYISVILMGLISVIFLQNMISSGFIKLLLLFLCLIFSFHQINFFKDYINNRLKNIPYLFYYLCAFKIAPWLWFSKILWKS